MNYSNLLSLDSTQNFEVEWRKLYNKTSHDKLPTLVNYIQRSLKQNSNRVLVEHAASGRKWTGEKLLDAVERFASNLIQQTNLNIGECVFVSSEHNDYELIATLGSLLAGAGVFPSVVEDGFAEHKVYCEIVKPKVLVINPQMHFEAVELRKTVAGVENAFIVWMDLHANDKRDYFDSNECQLINGNNNNNNNNNHSNGKQDQFLDSQSQVLLLSDLIGGEKNQQLLDNVVRCLKPHHPAIYSLTSGSTGAAKVVESSHESQLLSIEAPIFACHVPLQKQAFSQQTLDKQSNICAYKQTNNKQQLAEYLLPFTCDTIFAGDLPLEHGAGFTIMLMSLGLGSKVVLTPVFAADTYWQHISEFNITVGFTSTSFLAKAFIKLKSMILDGSAKRELNLESLQVIYGCGAKVAYFELIDFIRAHYPHLLVSQSYGATELGFISVVMSSESTKHLDSAGYLAPGLVCRLVDPSSGEIIVNAKQDAQTIGELQVKPLVMFSGYLTQKGDGEHFTRLVLTKDNYYKTGDLAHFDEQGRVHLHGRIKDTINLFGDWKIMPCELEQVVDLYPLVEFSAVVGVRDFESLGVDSPRAFVKLKQRVDLERLISPDTCKSIDSKYEQFVKALLASGKHTELTKQVINEIEADIAAFVARRVAPEKRLTAGVRVIEEFPENGALEKIDRNALKQLN